MSKLLITGGTGSFGNAYIQNTIDSKRFSEIYIFSRDEKKQDDLRKKYSNSKLKFFLGDIRDYDSVRDVVKNVDYIFHAAALKQVPSCEFFPMQAVKTNIIGASNVLNAAEEFNISKIVILSTDKAAYPINTMGMTKAIMEKTMIAKSRTSNSQTVYCGTRYGNVMGSRGSVIPLFVDQIINNKDITITNPEMTRFMMTLAEAVKLVDYAFDNGSQGDIFIQKSPATTIINLAEAIKEIFNSKSQIKLIGIRHGEKMYETLVTKEEMVKSKDMGKYFKISPDSRDLNYKKYFSEGIENTNEIEEYNSNNTIILDKNSLIKELLKLDIIKNKLNNK
jgi:UDP-glucose 4-epimerase